MLFFVPFINPKAIKAWRKFNRKVNKKNSSCQKKIIFYQQIIILSANFGEYNPVNPDILRSQDFPELYPQPFSKFNVEKNNELRNRTEEQRNKGFMI